MKILTVIGARPQFIKAATVSHLIRLNHTEIIVHTGQHYDERMSDIFFRELNLPLPDYNLEVGSAGHSIQTGQMLISMEPIFEKENPDWILVYGDTNSTLAGALAASKLHIPIAHVEAGLRSFNRAMPEEINRVLTDHISRLLFSPTQTSVENLKQEGITKGVYVVGDVMYDSILKYGTEAETKSNIFSILNLKVNTYLLATLHRPSNVENLDNLFSILETISEIDEIVIFPAHPRLMKKIKSINIKLGDNIKLIEPVGYLDMLQLEKNARIILTDSGGVQKEAYWFGVPCITLREETEWVETVQSGWNIVTGLVREKILTTVHNFSIPVSHPNLYGDGDASSKIIQLIENESK